MSPPSLRRRLELPAGTVLAVAAPSPSAVHALTGCGARKAALWRSIALTAPLLQLCAMEADMGSGKISSSPHCTPSKIARATDSEEAFGISKPRVISVSVGPVKTCLLYTSPSPRDRQ